MRASAAAVTKPLSLLPLLPLPVVRVRVPVSGRVGVCVQRLAFTIYTKGWEEAGKGRA